MTDTQNRFFWFVKEREAIRLKREQGLPPPWTTDTILQVGRFCNVNREHDAVTIWIKEHVRDNATCQPIVLQLFVSRVFNHPPTLQHILPFRNRFTLISQCARLRRSGKILRGAYMVAPHGPTGRGKTPEDYYGRAAEDLSKLSFASDTSLKAVADKMLTVHGIGKFFANQVCTDLRYISDSWEDWDTFVLAGPGTRRGINRWDGVKVTMHRSPQLYIDKLLEIRLLADRELPTAITRYFRDINNLSNCFCEFDKYERARLDSTSIRRKYAYHQ